MPLKYLLVAHLFPMDVMPTAVKFHELLEYFQGQWAG